MHESASALRGQAAAIHYTVSSSNTCFAEKKPVQHECSPTSFPPQMPVREMYFICSKCKKALKYLQKRAAIIDLQPNFPSFFLSTAIVVSSQSVPTLLQAHHCYTYGRNCSMKERKQVSDSMATALNSQTSFLFQAWYDYQEGSTDAHNFITNLLTMTALGHHLSQRSMKSKTPTFLSSPL